MSVSSQLVRLESAKSALRVAINNLGGTITDETLEQFAGVLNAMPNAIETMINAHNASAGAHGSAFAAKAAAPATETKTESFTAIDNRIYTVDGGSSAITITCPTSGQIYGSLVIYTVATGTLTFLPSASTGYIGDDMTDWHSGDVWEFSLFNGRIIGKKWGAA